MTGNISHFQEKKFMIMYIDSFPTCPRSQTLYQFNIFSKELCKIKIL